MTSDEIPAQYCRRTYGSSGTAIDDGPMPGVFVAGARARLMHEKKLPGSRRNYAGIDLAL